MHNCARDQFPRIVLRVGIAIWNCRQLYIILGVVDAFTVACLPQRSTLDKVIFSRDTRSRTTRLHCVFDCNAISFARICLRWICVFHRKSYLFNIHLQCAEEIATNSHSYFASSISVWICREPKQWDFNKEQAFQCWQMVMNMPYYRWGEVPGLHALGSPSSTIF